MPHIGVNIKFKSRRLPAGYSFVIDSAGKRVIDNIGRFVIARKWIP
jgi:hypothetical protein